MSHRSGLVDAIWRSRTNQRTIGLIAVFAMLIAATIAIPGGALSPTRANAVGAPAENAVEQHFAWNPNTQAWSTGQPKDYTEGETAPFRVLINAFAEPGESYFTNVCLEITSSPGKYAFTGFENWDLTYGGEVTAPTTAQVGAGFGQFQGVGLTVTYSEVLTIGANGCPTDFLAAYVEFTMDGDSTNGPEGSAGAIVYGGHIAAPGDTLPEGLGEVPPGGGAGSINGVFQAAMGDGSGGNKTVNFKGSDIIPLAPEIQIEKSTNGEDADAAPGPNIAVGATVAWTYEVTNIGSTDVHDVTVVDDVEGSISCPSTSLAAGASMTCTLDGTAEAGQYANIATVTGVDNFDQQATDDDPSHYFGVSGGIHIEKSTNGQDADTATGPYIAVGDAVNWTYTVTNTGNTPLSNIAVTDDQGETPVYQSGDTNNDSKLDLDETWIYTASSTAVAGQYTNVGMAAGDDAADENQTDTDPSHYFGVSGGLDIEKATNGEDADTATGPYVPVGDPVTWSYVVTNNSNATVTGIAVTDDVEGAITCPKDSLTTGESMECTANGTAEAGQYANLGSVTGDDAVGAQLSDSDPSHYFGLISGINIEKSTNDQDADTPTGPVIAAGTTVNWEYRVTNTGNTPISNVVVTDDQGETVLYQSGDLNTDSMLDPGETWTFVATGTAEAGQYANLGSVTGEDAGGTQLSDSDPSHYFGVPEGSLDILKLVDDLEGGWVANAFYPNSETDATWQITVTNDGPTDLHDLVLTDVNAASCEAAFDTAISDAGWKDGDSLTLPSGESVTFECDSTIVASAPAINTAVVVGFDPIDREVGPVESSATISRVAASGVIGDTVWYDTNDNGVQDGAEAGIAGVKVTIIGLDGQDVDPVTGGVQTTFEQTTDGDGKYLFSGLNFGMHRVEVNINDVPDPEDRSLRFTTASTFTVDLPDGGEYLLADFGVISDELPVTGLNTDSLLVIAILLMVAGSVAVLVARREDDDNPELAA